MPNRKKQSEQKLHALGVPIHEGLATIEDDVTIRAKEEVVDRLIALTIVAAKALDAPSTQLQSFIQHFDAMPLLSAQEQQFILNTNAPKTVDAAFSWRIESVWLLLWALQLIPQLDDAEQECDVTIVFKMVLHATKEELLHRSTLRSNEEILAALDFTYRAHWAVKEALINSYATPAKIQASVIYERHYALNWLVHYMDQSWDDISTDT